MAIAAPTAAVAAARGGGAAAAEVVIDLAGTRRMVKTDQHRGAPVALGDYSLLVHCFKSYRVYGMAVFACTAWQCLLAVSLESTHSTASVH